MTLQVVYELHDEDALLVMRPIRVSSPLRACAGAACVGLTYATYATGAVSRTTRGHGRLLFVRICVGKAEDVAEDVPAAELMQEREDDVADKVGPHQLAEELVVQ